MTRFGLQLPNFTLGVSDGELFEKFVDIAVAGEESGFNSLWVMDHFYQLPALGGAEQPMLEAYTVLGALAARTSTARLGTLVTGVTYRNPAMLAKIVTTLDIISGGRAILGIGAAWHDEEHEGLGFDFPSVKERMERLEEAVQICRAMFREDAPSFDGRHFRIDKARNVPKPIQAGGPPIMIGGGGEQRTLKLVAQYADMCNVSGDLETVRHKFEVLLRHCEAVGRDPSEITRTRMTPAAKATRVEILRDGVLVAQRERSAPPVVKLLGPKSGADVPDAGPVTVRWKARDAEGATLSARVDVSVDDGITWRPFTVTADDQVDLDAAALPKTAEGRFRVSVNDGFDEAAAISARLRFGGANPVARITSLAAGSNVRADAGVQLAGDGYDDRLDPLRGRALRWLVDGHAVGAGNTASIAGLAPGAHDVVLEARDGFGRVGRDQVSVTVDAVAPTFLRLHPPKHLSKSAHTLHITMASSVVGELHVGQQSFDVGPAPKTLKVRVKPGGSDLVLALELRADGLSTAAGVTVQRR